MTASGVRGAADGGAIDDDNGANEVDDVNRLEDDAVIGGDKGLLEQRLKLDMNLS